MLIGVVSGVGYAILIAVEKYQIAKLVIITTAMMAILATMENLTPVINRWSARVDSLQDTANRVAGIGQGGWLMPMKGTVSQEFKGNDHHGLDIAAPEGTPVSAAKKGEIVRVGWSDIYGNVIIVDHGGGMESLYGHLGGLSVRVGYPVIAGAQIGSCGNTGRSTGPHLHFEIRKNGTSVDPSSYF